jgi:NAD(P)-dependent dehydrogenase (short-subunit alcohol dehydrogenase family)
LNEKVAVVTGAGSGIGRATALALAAQGAVVVVTDVRESTAQATAGTIAAQGGTSRAFALDVADPGQMEQLAVQVKRLVGVPSILVNNAGIGVAGLFLDTRPESIERIVSINLMGVMHGCSVFLPEMIAAGQGGHIVNLASMAGYVASAKMSVYTATKFAVLGFSESLRAEMHPHGIGVSAICPGIVHTNIIRDSVLELPDEDAEAKRESLDHFYRKRNYTPERVAAAIIKAIRKNRAVQPVTPEAWAGYYVKRFFPGFIHWLARQGLV